MTLAGAITRLGTWAVTGVTTNYGLAFPGGMPPDSALPALLVWLSAEPAGAVKPFDVALTNTQTEVRIDHVLLYSGVNRGTLAARQAGIITLIDNYLAKVKTDWTLNGTLLQPLRLSAVTVGTVLIANQAFYGVTFRHQWRLVL